MRLWPRTLYGRLVIILVSGMIAAQIATSSIWYDVRHSQVLEIPTRLIASRLADIVRVIHIEPTHTNGFIGHLNTPDFRLQFIEAPTPRTEKLSSADEATERLLNNVIEQRTGIFSDLRLLHLSLLDDQGHAAGMSTLFGSSPAAGMFNIEVHLPDGRWLQVRAREDQGWTSLTPVQVMFDYFLRIYLVRIILLAIVVLLAVRLAIRPLTELTQAAQALGADIKRPPLALNGPLEVRRAAKAFNSMQQRLINNLRERTRFLAAISHDLRSPITRLRLRTEMLADEQAKERFRKDLEDMENMVASTLEFVSSGEVNEPRQSVDINALLQSLQADFQDMNAQVALHGTALEPLPAYSRSLKRCVQNLLENAIRYGHQADIFIEDQPERLRIVIADQGPGIPEDQLEQVVEPFFRLESSRNAGTGGYGLGLSIAHTVAAAHEGRLQLRNRESGGLEAILDLPRV
ncbi:ATP-binding protein [Pseudomonas sp. NPDC088368]|uniref:ATP-binding protein n=1 Tax=Pseudomonas sp. NPDC088368 TaxID=3364453 RepID=UPI003819B65C